MKAVSLAAAVLLNACGAGSSTLGGSPAAANGTSVMPESVIHGFSPLFNRAGNVLIADQFNNRVIEIDPATHRIVWDYTGIIGTNDAERVSSDTLMAGTGVPANSPPFEPGCSAGCPDNRVILVDPFGHIVWQYGQFKVSGSGPDQLNTPVQATALSSGNVLITDQGNSRVIEVNREKNIVFQYGTTGVSGSGFNQLNNPNSAQLLPSGTILIADENNNRVIEVNGAHQVVWQYPVPVNTSKLNGAAFASRLPNGNTLITDSNNNRVVEIDRNKNVVWTYSTLTPGGNTNPLPTRAIRLANGNTLISDQFNDRVIEVHKTGPASGTIVFTQGMLNHRGSGFDQLNAPYDAKVIGDYTGLSNPTP